VRTILILSVAAAAFALAACAEREQTGGSIKSDAAPYAGTNKQPPFMAVGWKPGDRNAWEAQVKTRTVNGQNDYVKVP
jgi:predicted small secreted protein